jgi:hypothetical protein
VRVFRRRSRGEEDGEIHWDQIGNIITSNVTGVGIDSNSHDYYKDADMFGWAVALASEGTILAIGAPWHGTYRTGLVRVYCLNDEYSTWEQFGQDITGEPCELFGWEFNCCGQFGWQLSLSADGMTVAISSLYSDKQLQPQIPCRGNVEAYHMEEDGLWAKVGQTIISSDISTPNEGWTYFVDTPGWRSGWSVDLSADGKILAVGARWDAYPESGHVRVYQLQDIDGTCWEHLGQIINENATYGFSLGQGDVSLSADGGTVAIGSNDDETVMVFSWNNNESDWEPRGQGIDFGGHSVSLSADASSLAIGEPWHGKLGSCAGQVSLYRWIDDDSCWKSGEVFVGEMPEDEFGRSLSFSADGNVVAAGAPGHKSNSGQVKIFTLNNDPI